MQGQCGGPHHGECQQGEHGAVPVLIPVPSPAPAGASRLREPLDHGAGPRAGSCVCPAQAARSRVWKLSGPGGGGRSTRPARGPLRWTVPGLSLRLAWDGALSLGLAGGLSTDPARGIRGQSTTASGVQGPLRAPARPLYSPFWWQIALSLRAVPRPSPLLLPDGPSHPKLLPLPSAPRLRAGVRPRGPWQEESATGRCDLGPEQHDAA